MTMNNKIKYLLVGAVVLISIILGACSLKGQDESIFIEQEEEVTESAKVTEGFEADEGVRRSDEEIISSDTEEAKDEEVQVEVVVHVCGQVMSPGVYTLKSGSRLYEAIESAGGMTEEADSEYLNQADLVRDGSKIYVPSREETKELNADDRMSSDDILNAVTSSQEIRADEGLDGRRCGDSDETGDKVNINTATKEQLMTLKGVGESKADSIISYREANGPFSSIEDIMNITGIKEGLFNKVKDQITV